MFGCGNVVRADAAEIGLSVFGGLLVWRCDGSDIAVCSTAGNMAFLPVETKSLSRAYSMLGSCWSVSDSTGLSQEKEASVDSAAETAGSVCSKGFPEQAAKSIPMHREIIA